METASLTHEQRGHYLGTEIDEKWWRRDTRDGLLARGLGRYWIGEGGFFFHRHLTTSPIVILLADLCEVKVGRWHAGRWAGGAPVVKLVWMKGDLRLSSGFVVSRDARVTDGVVAAVRAAATETAQPPARPARRMQS